MLYNQQMYPGYMPNSMNYGMQPQTIQQFPNQTPQSLCYFVKSIDEMSNFKVMPNVFYMGINRDNKEIYVRRMNNDGNIEMESYVLKSEEKQKSEFEMITERLTNIETVLKERKDERFNEYVNKQPVNEQTRFNASNGYVQSNDVR